MNNQVQEENIDQVEDSDNKAVKGGDAARSVQKGTIIVLAIILVSMIWYLLADRFTPYTQQARVQGFVVGVAPKVAGIVTQVWVKNDQRVEKDQPLFEIDRAQYEIALKKAESDLENTRREVDAGSADIESARANLRVAEADRLKAEQDAVRKERLYKEDPGSISVRRLEVAMATLKKAEATVDRAQSEIQKAIERKGGEEDDNSKLKAALSAVEKARLDLDNTIVKASSDGVITDLSTEVGQFAGTGNAIMTLIAIHDVWINAEFTENNLGNIRQGSPVELVLDSMPGKVFTGKIRSIGLGVSGGQATPAGSLPTIDNSRDWLRQSQRFPVIISFDPEQREDLIRNVRIGGQAEVIAYSEGHGLLKLLGKIYIRLMSWLSYAY